MTQTGGGRGPGWHGDSVQVVWKPAQQHVGLQIPQQNSHLYVQRPYGGGGQHKEVNEK